MHNPMSAALVVPPLNENFVSLTMLRGDVDADAGSAADLLSSLDDARQYIFGGNDYALINKDWRPVLKAKRSHGGHFFRQGTMSAVSALPLRSAQCACPATRCARRPLMCIISAVDPTLVQR